MLSELDAHTCYWCHHELSDALAVLDGEGLAAQVDQDHLHLAAVVFVDGAR